MLYQLQFSHVVDCAFFLNECCLVSGVFSCHKLAYNIVVFVKYY